MDFKKAYDTVWREGLFFKFLQHYEINPKFVRIVHSMYNKAQGLVKIDSKMGKLFDKTICLRQGCNLSPQLFNLYIDAFPKLIHSLNNSPVTLNGINIPCLLYADDILLPSTSAYGLQLSLNALGVYCEKWQLVVNAVKTKIMVFNKSLSPLFSFKGCRIIYILRLTNP